MATIDVEGVITTSQEEAIPVANGGRICIVTLNGMSGSNFTIRAAPLGFPYESSQPWTANGQATLTQDGIYDIYCYGVKVWLEHNGAEFPVKISANTFT
jgi:hypothetical protein